MSDFLIPPERFVHYHTSAEIANIAVEVDMMHCCISQQICSKAPTCHFDIATRHTEALTHLTPPPGPPAPINRIILWNNKSLSGGGKEREEEGRQDQTIHRAQGKNRKKEVIRWEVRRKQGREKRGREPRRDKR